MFLSFPLTMALFCTFCSYCCEARLDLVKHAFGVHSVEPTFYLVCGIKGCLHSFTFGATFSSFKTHATRKHPRWQEYVNEVEPEDSALPLVPSLNQDCGHEVSEPPELMAPVNNCSFSVPGPSVQPKSYPQTTQRTAALFLLTFQEKYRLSQTAINFAVGSINALVDSVHESIKASVLDRLKTGAATVDLSVCFDHDDPFASLQTEYQQSKFYREEFGLVVNGDVPVYIIIYCGIYFV